MHHHIFAEAQSTYTTAILIKSANFHKQSIEYYYVRPLVAGGIPEKEIVAFDLDYEKGKAPAAVVKNCVANLLPALRALGVKQIIVADSVYFKAFTGSKKAEAMLGYMVPCKHEGFQDMQVTVSTNYAAGSYNDSAYDKIDIANNTVITHVSGSYKEPGADIIKHRVHPQTVKEVEEYLDSLLTYPELTVDIEAFSLQFWKAGIGSIAFSQDSQGGGSFLVDYVPLAERNEEGHWGYQKHNPEIKALLRSFFTNYQGRLIGQNLSYDFKVLIYELFMDNPLDEKGKQRGIEILTRCFDDTKLTIFLTTNACSLNDLSLKTNAQSFAGNYGQDSEDIRDIRRIPPNELLEYNLVDTMSTFFVFNNTREKVKEEVQEEVYQTIFKPSVKLFLQVELTGMPLDMARVKEVKAELETIREEHNATIRAFPLIKDVEETTRRTKWEKDYESRKSKAKNPEKIMPKDYLTFPEAPFNINSNGQVQELLYTFMQLPVIDRTKGKQPAVGADTLKKLVNHTPRDDYKEVLKGLISFFKVDKILSTFISAFLENSFEKNGWWYLHGSFNIGGTKSGRLSSSGPNLQNMPSGSFYGKMIKSCFKAPPGWLFVGADFASLEDRISALTTKDPNKLKVYQGHEIYELEIDGAIHHIRDDAIISYDGITYTGYEFYAKYSNSTL